MKKTLTLLALALAAGGGTAVLAQSQHQQHQQHQQQQQPQTGAPAAPSTGASPMHNMPESCRAAMQAMPPSCMGAMHQMMQGGMMRGGGGAGAGGHAQHGAGQAAAAAQPAFTKAYVEAMDRMHEPMMAGVQAPDADVAFVRGMIPHHQGAIDMARIVLAHGKDEQVRKWATDVIREQMREIGEMEAWLAKNGK